MGSGVTPPRGAALHAGLLGLLLLLVFPVGAAVAQPAAGPRETIDQRFTTQTPGSPAGIRFEGKFHRAGDSKGRPPYLQRMVFHPPRGMRYDTSVPKRCTASDAELQIMGPAACPAGSRLVRGSSEGQFMVPFSEEAVFHRFRHRTHVFNNTNEQIVLIESEGFTVVRGRIRADGSLVFETPTCFPVNPAGECVDDYIRLLATTSWIPPYTRKAAGRVRSYAKTPPRCPARGHWLTRVRFRFANGAVDTVATRQPCRRPGR